MRKKKIISIISLSGLLTFGLVTGVLTSCDKGQNQEITYSISAGETDGATLNFSKTSAKEGETITVIVVTPTGQEVDTISATGVTFNSGSTSGTYTFTMPASDVVVNVTLKDEVVLTSYKVEISREVDEALTIKVDKDRAYKGDTVTISVSDIPTGKVVDTVTVTSGETSLEVNKVDDTTYTFTMPEGDVSVMVTLKDAPKASYNLNVNAPEGIEVIFNLDTNQKTAEVGETVSFVVFEVPENKEIDQVTVTGIEEGGLTKSDDRPQYEFTMPNNEITVNVTLKDITDTTGYNKVTINKPEGVVAYLSRYSFKYNASVTPKERICLYIASVAEDDKLETVKINDSPLYDYGSKLYTYEIIPVDLTIDIQTTKSLANTDFTLSVADYSQATITFEDNRTTAKPGETVRFSVSGIEEGYRIASIQDVGYNITSSDITLVDEETLTYEFIMPAANVNLYATVELIPVEYTLTITNNTEYTIELLDQSTWDYITVGSEPLNLVAGYVYQVMTEGTVSLTLNGEPLDSTTFTMPSENSTLVINPVQTYGYTLTVGEEDSGEVGLYEYNPLRGGVGSQIGSKQQLVPGEQYIVNIYAPQATLTPVVYVNNEVAEVYGEGGGAWDYIFTMPNEEVSIEVRWEESEVIEEYGWSFEEVNGEAYGVSLYPKGSYTPIQLEGTIPAGTELTLQIDTWGMENANVSSVTLNGSILTLTSEEDGYFNYDCVMPNEEAHFVITYGEATTGGDTGEETPTSLNISYTINGTGLSMDNIVTMGLSDSGEPTPLTGPITPNQTLYVSFMCDEGYQVTSYDLNNTAYLTDASLGDSGYLLITSGTTDIEITFVVEPTLN